MLAVFEGSIEQRFRGGLNNRQRSLEFMRHVGDEFAPHISKSPQFGHVVQHKDHA